MRGVEGKHEYSQRNIIRDTRPMGQRVAETMGDANFASIVFIVAGLVLIFMPSVGAVSDVLLLFGLLYGKWFKVRGARRVLPLRKPSHSNELDYGDPSLLNGRPQMAAGIMYIGNDRETGEECWVKNEDARQHLSFAGTTGSGKSEGFKSLSANSLTWGSGVIYIDGKADTKLWADFWALARRFGRDDDVLVLNYITGNSDSGAVSNSLNPFTYGASGPLSELIVSLMADAGSDPMWKERAIGLVKAVMSVLTWLRDNKGLLLGPGVIRSSLTFADVVKLSRRRDIPENLRHPIMAYLTELPGYDDDAYDDDGKAKPQPPNAKTASDPAEVVKQHNYLTMQLTRALGSLNDDFGNIFTAQRADIDLRDVVLNRRILIVLLPALEVSEDSLANLGKIVVSSLKGMMATTLGSMVEGEWEEAIENKPTNSPSPTQAIFDEAGYYIVPGFDVMFAQARSLGFNLNVGFQDVPALKKRVAEAADSVLGNANIQLWGKLTDGGETRDKFEKACGEVTVMEVAGYSATVGAASINYNDRMDAAPQRRLRGEWLDVKGQVEGQVHITFSDRMSRAQLFYAAPKKTRTFRVPRFLQVGAVSAVDSLRVVPEEVRVLADKLRDETWSAYYAAPTVERSKEISLMLEGFKTSIGSGQSALQAGCVAVASLMSPMDLKAQRMKAALERNKVKAVVKIEDEEPVEITETPLDETEEEIVDVIDAGNLFESSIEKTKARVDQLAEETRKDDFASLAKYSAEQLSQLTPEVDGETSTAGGNVSCEPSLFLPETRKPQIVVGVDNDEIRENLIRIEEASGIEHDEAVEDVDLAMSKIEEATRYPEPPIPEKGDPDHLKALLLNVQNAITGYGDGVSNIDM